MADQRQIGFCPDVKAARVIAAERKRLQALRGKDVGKAEAVRSLIHKAAEKTDAAS